jgi:hypothetical protein
MHCGAPGTPARTEPNFSSYRAALPPWRIFKARQLRARPFSTEQVYMAALTNELERLGIQPSPAKEASNSIWKEWEKKNAPEGQKIYALVMPDKDGWVVELCWRKASGGSLYRWGRTGSKSAEMELPGHVFAVIPISDIVEYVSRKMSALLGG